jgi:hypothetical protein
MIDKITNQPLFESGAQLNQLYGGRSVPDRDTDVSVRVDHANLMKMALQIPQSDSEQLERARQALLSGELESPDNILEAAENLYNFGV